MKYMLLIYGAENSWTEPEREACMIESMGICDELAAKGKFFAASPLQSVTTAATVRVRDGKAFITDGPFAETTEQLGGYYLLDLADLDEAIAVASRLPPAKKGTVEIRPLSTLEGLPPPRTLPEPDGSHHPFLFLCYDDETTWTALGDAALQQAKAEATGLAGELHREGRYINASPLHPGRTATCVRVRNGKREVTDGPFAETHEVLGGFYVILVESRDVALQYAARHPGARLTAVEVRPLFDTSHLQKSRSTSPSTRT